MLLTAALPIVLVAAVAAEAGSADGPRVAARFAAEALQAAGAAHYEQYEFALAADEFQRALALRRALGDRRGEADALARLGWAISRRGEIRKHPDIARQVVALWRDIGDAEGEANALDDLLRAQINAGTLQDALDGLRDLVRIRRAQGNRIGEAAALNNLGTVYDLLGDGRAAVDAIAQALSIHEALTDRDDEPYEASTLSNLGGAYSSLGDSGNALEYYRRALELHTRLGLSPVGEGSTLNNMAYELSRRGRHQEAIAQLDRALQLSAKSHNPWLEAAAVLNRGVARAALGQRALASADFQRALELARTLDDRSREARALYQWARLANEASDLADARTRVEDALEVLEAQRRGLRNSALRATLMATFRDAYELKVDVLMGLHRAQPAAGFDALALRASELARARALLDRLGEAAQRIGEGVDPRLVEEEGTLQDRVSAAVERHMRLVVSGASEERTRAAAAEVQALTPEWEAAKARLKASSPRYAALQDPQPLGVADIQRLVLDDDTVLLEYALGEKRSFLWAIGKDSLSAYELPARAEIERSARAVYARLSRARGAGPGAAGDPRARLTRLVLAPAAAVLGSKRLLVVPDGALHYVPFASLPDPSAAGEPLVARHEIVNLPSASTLAMLRQDVPRPPSPRTLVAIADPVFGHGDERLPRAVRAQPPAAPGPAAMRDIVRAIGGRARGGDLPRLPFTRREAEAILQLVPSGQRTERLGFDATRAAAIAPALADYRMVHFATHGFFNAAHPELSGLVLSLVDRQGREVRGFVSVADVFNLRLNADLVVLSGCRTALGSEIYGEGVVGLSRAFMYAGSPRLVASLWQVDDVATATLMTEFYRGILSRGLTPAASLRAAQRYLMARARYRDPYYWAAFHLQGEWR